ncbi:hypothetical protein D3C76_715570 [compost metagenome]
MTTQLSEEEMRRALFGATGSTNTSTSVGRVDTSVGSRPARGSKSATFAKAASSKLRVTLHVSNVFEGDYEIVDYDTSTLSKIVAELDAKKMFKKKYKYVTVVSVAQI